MNHYFSFSFFIDFATSVGDDEITKNILIIEGYFKWISTTIVTLIAVLPISKLSIIRQPMTTFLDSKFGDT
jgi:hypothetical protein